MPKHTISHSLALSIALFAFPARADTTPQTLPFVQDWSNAGLITASDSWAGVPGITGYRGDGLTTSTNTNPSTILGDGSGTPVDVNANQTNPNTFTTGGVSEFAIPDPVVALAGSGTASAPHLVIVVDTTGIADVRVQVDLRDIDGSADNAVQQVALQYRVGSVGNYTNVTDGYVADATTGPSLATLVTPINVVLPTSAGNQPALCLRVLTTDASGSDEWVGIDNIRITDASLPPVGVGTAAPASLTAGGDIQLTATVTPGVYPDSTGLSVECDLTELGLGALELFDDGSHGDGANGDHTFGNSTTISASTPVGVYTLPCVVVDGMARESAFDIALTVLPICGDGIPEGTEECDDGGLQTGDGCADDCTVEAGYTCSEAPSTCIDLDECTLATDDCDPNATCANTPGSFTCTCNTGFVGNGVTCTDLDECTLATDDCDPNATCANTPGSFTCTCNTGFVGNGVTCTDLDECTLATDDCDPNATCANTPGSFTCTCDGGFYGDGITCATVCGDAIQAGSEACDDGGTVTGDGCSDVCTVEAGYDCTGAAPSMCTDRDECTLATDDCDVNATCANTPGGFTCTCDSGFVGNGVTCTDLDECTLATDDCGVNATCANTPGGFTCTCDSGFYGDGITCATVCGDAIQAGSEACDDGGTGTGDGCSDVCTVEAGYDCTGAAPSMCTDRDECTLGTDNCDVNATCANTPGGFTCTCDSGFYGDGITCATVCGDGIQAGSEACDDGNTSAGDGCDATCAQESHFVCSGEPSACLPDGDGDTVPDAIDNCPLRANTDQLDGDDDGAGDACEEAVPPVNTPDSGGCDCAATDAGSSPLGLLVLAVAGVLRRRKVGFSRHHPLAILT